MDREMVIYTCKKFRFWIEVIVEANGDFFE